MSSPEHDPKQTTSTPDGALPPGGGEVINVRRGMFGVTDTGDTSGYGRLVREVTLPGSSPRPYSGYIDTKRVFCPLLPGMLRGRGQLGVRRYDEILGYDDGHGGVDGESS